MKPKTSFYLYASYILVACFILSVASICIYLDVPPSFFLRDPASTLEVSPFVGLQSNLGAFMLLSAGSIALFSYFLMMQRTTRQKPGKLILWSGVLSFLLFLDDFFMLHEQRFFWGLGEKHIFVIYGLFFLVLFTYFLSSKIKFAVTPLFLIFAFFGLSLLIDFKQYDWDSPWRIFWEDGFKLMGIVSWFSFVVHSCSMVLSCDCFDDIHG